MTIAEPPRPDHAFQHSNWGANIAAEADNVLPRLPVWAITDALRRLPEEELALALRLKILPTVTLPGIKLFAAFGQAARAMAGHDGLRLMAEAPPADFIAASRSALGSELLKEATSGAWPAAIRRGLPPTVAPSPRPPFCGLPPSRSCHRL